MLQSLHWPLLCLFLCACLARDPLQPLTAPAPARAQLLSLLQRQQPGTAQQHTGKATGPRHVPAHQGLESSAAPTRAIAPPPALRQPGPGPPEGAKRRGQSAYEKLKSAAPQSSQAPGQPRVLYAMFGVIPRSIRCTWWTHYQRGVLPLRQAGFHVDIYVFNLHVQDTKVDDTSLNNSDISIVPYRYRHCVQLTEHTRHSALRVGARSGGGAGLASGLRFEI